MLTTTDMPRNELFNAYQEYSNKCKMTLHSREIDVDEIVSV